MNKALLVFAVLAGLALHSFAQVTSGPPSGSVVSTNFALLNGGNTFTAANTFKTNVFVGGIVYPTNGISFAQSNTITGGVTGTTNKVVVSGSTNANFSFIVTGANGTGTFSIASGTSDPQVNWAGWTLDKFGDVSTTGFIHANTITASISSLGSENLAVKTVATDYSITPTDGIVQVDATGGTRKITLMAPNVSNPIVTVMKKDSSGNGVVITNATALINGKFAYTNTSVYSTATFYTDGTNYFLR